MCYAKIPDWKSLVSARLYDSLVEGRRYSIGGVTESLRNWADPDFTDDRLMAGSFAPVDGEMSPLTASLRWSANAVAGGVLGNTVYDLLKIILR